MFSKYQKEKTEKQHYSIFYCARKDSVAINGEDITKLNSIYYETRCFSGVDQAKNRVFISYSVVFGIVYYMLSKHRYF